MRRSAAVAALIGWIAAPAAAQTAAPADVWGIAGELGLNAARGNSSYTMLSTSMRVTHLNKKQFELDWGSTLTYGESNGAVIARRMATTFKVDYRPGATWSPFAFNSIERDRIRKLDALGNAGVGAKWTFFRNKAGSASLSAAGLYSRKDIVSDTAQVAWRFSLRPKIVQKNAQGWSFEQTTFYQPELGNATDYNIDAVTRIGFSPNKVSTLFTQYTYRVDSRPPLGVKREDQLMVAGVKLSF